MPTPLLCFRASRLEKKTIDQAANELSVDRSCFIRNALTAFLYELNQEGLISPPPSASPEVSFALRLRKEAP
jgi:hypothetical protein